jgi:hypothetical protein
MKIAFSTDFLITIKFRINATFMTLDLHTIFRIQYTRTFVVYVAITLHVPSSPFSVFIATAEDRVVAIFFFHCDKNIR